MLKVGSGGIVPGTRRNSVRRPGCGSATSSRYRTSTYTTPRIRPPKGTPNGNSPKHAGSLPPQTGRTISERKTDGKEGGARRSSKEPLLPRSAHGGICPRYVRMESDHAARVASLEGKLVALEDKYSKLKRRRSLESEGYVGQTPLLKRAVRKSALRTSRVCGAVTALRGASRRRRFGCRYRTDIKVLRHELGRLELAWMKKALPKGAARGRASAAVWSPFPHASFLTAPTR